MADEKDLESLKEKADELRSQAGAAETPAVTETGGTLMG